MSKQSCQFPVHLLARAQARTVNKAYEAINGTFFISFSSPSMMGKMRSIHYVVERVFSVREFGLNLSNLAAETETISSALIR